jgi:peptidoglycan DL-endopeptidase CwlO
MRRSSVIFAAAVAATLSIALVGASSAATPRQQIRDKQAQAKKVYAEIQQLDARFGVTVEQWHGAKYQLARAEQELTADKASLRAAEHQRRLALAHVSERVVSLYEGEDAPSTMAILLGARSLSGLLDELQAAHAVAAADHRLAAQATAVRNRYARAVQTLAVTERQKQDAVDQLDHQRAQISSMLTERKALASSIQSELVKLQAEEARRQAALRAEAEARLAREAAARKKAEEEAAAAAAAAAAAKRKQQEQAVAAKPAAPAPTVTPSTTNDPVTTTTTTTTTTVPTPPPAGPVSGGHPEAATIALRYLGVPYVWGGSTPSGFDCSGLVMYVYAQLGIQLPHFAAAQYTYGSPVSRDQLQPGDLVFFEDLGHVGIYIGGGQVVHAPSTGDVVKISNISDWGDSYVGARRI